MTIKIKITNRPVVKSTHPELYVNHTFHMKKAICFTYNYSSLDDYIVQNWATKGQKAIASDMNELLHRVQYRCEVLKKIGLIEPRYKQPSRTKLMKEYKVLMTQANAIKEKMEA